MELIIATNNAHKVEEIKKEISYKFNVLSLKEVGIVEEIPEDHNTLEGNALQKARYIYNNYSKNCFADDTGLEVEALGNAPGVYSARYAGAECSSDKNINKLLQEMEGKENRHARFRTVIALIMDGKEHLFEGEVQGIILNKREEKDDNGFGYDPIFKPIGYNKSFAMMDLTEKNKISHRGKSIRKLIEFLETIR